MLDGIDDLRRQLQQLARDLEARAAPLAVRAGLDVLEAAVQRRTPVRTGALVAAEVETDPQDSRGFVAGYVSVTSDHCAAVEFGTSRQAAEPYMRPAAEEDGPKALDAAADAMGDLIQGAVECF